MAEDSEDNYAAAIGRSMWRLAKRRALSLVEVGNEAAQPVGLTQAALRGAPENKGRQPLRSPRQDANEQIEAPLTLREFLQKLGAELGKAEPPRDAT